jgi:hypothetical protein
MLALIISARSSHTHTHSHTDRCVVKCGKISRSRSLENSPLGEVT